MSFGYPWVNQKNKESSVKKIHSVSPITRNNWILDAGLFLAALVTILSGVYFLIFPDGGYKGGRNPYYGIQILFEREGWEWMHTWIGLGMVVIAAIHLLFHWKWVKNTTVRVWGTLFKRTRGINRASAMNIIVDVILAFNFIVCSLTGFYFLFFPEVKGGGDLESVFLFSRTIWDALHTWSGVLMISAALIHFVIHWGWVTKVTRKIFAKARADEVLTVAPNLFNN